MKREKEREREPQSRCGWTTRTIRKHSSNCSQIAVRAIGDETGCAKDEDWDEGCAAGSRECQLSVAIQATCGASL
jgi:hypothetical protein